jgi:Protein of unknown function (DUF4058)
MPSPFPGMNPYLENPALWSKIHKRLIVAIADFLSPQLLPKYIVDIEDRVYQTVYEESVLVGIPDVAVQRQQNIAIPEITNVAVAIPPVKAVTVDVPVPETIKESYLEVRDVVTREVITVIEILSPKNKRLGEGRKAYEKKRLRVMGSFSNLVEIDLLRDGKPMTILNSNIQSHYRILVSRTDKRPKADLYAFDLPNMIPSFSLPLREEDLEPVVDLQTMINELYDRTGYGLLIDYSQEPISKLSEKDVVWLDTLLRQKGLR